MPRPGLALRILVVLFTPLATGGCAGAGLAAAGPLWSAIQVVTDRSVERTLAADLPTGWGATLDALARMGIRVRDSAQGVDHWTLRGDGDKITINAELTRVTASMTRLSLTVEAGRIGADKQTGEEILNQVVASLAPQSVIAPREVRSDRGASPEAVGALEAEVRRLRSEIERNGPTSRPAPMSPRPAPMSTPVVVSDGVVTIPETYGLPAPVTRSATPSQPFGRPGAPVSAHADTSASPDTSANLAEEILARALKPVSTLVPVHPIGGGRSPE